MINKLDYYRVFDEAATQQSFSIAAENLFVTQSAISQVIRQLESELACKLFIRGSKGVSLTKEGELLYSYIHNAMNLMDIAEKRLQERKQLAYGTLVIGAGDTISSRYLLPYLEKFHTLYPKVKIQMMNRTSLEMIDLVNQQKVDIAFMNLPIEDEHLDITPCFEVHDIFVCGNKYKDDKVYTLQEICERPLILLEKNSNSRRYIDDYFIKNHIKLLPQIEIGAHELLLELAQINLGVSCVVQEFSEEFLTTGKVHTMHLKDPIPSRYIGYATSKRIQMSPATQKFIALLPIYEDNIEKHR